MGENADTVKARSGTAPAGATWMAPSRPLTRTPRSPSCRKPFRGAAHIGVQNGWGAMIQKFVSNFESIDPKPTAFLEADDGETVIVTVEGMVRPSPEMSSAGDPSGSTR